MEIEYILHKRIARLSSEGYWGKELNLISWRGHSPKYDIRCWTSDHTKIGKGVSLSRSEAIALRDALNALDLGESE